MRFNAKLMEFEYEFKMLKESSVASVASAASADVSLRSAVVLLSRGQPLLNVLWFSLLNCSFGL